MTSGGAGSGAEARVRVGRRSLEVARPDKVMFPDAGHTKLDLVRFARRIAEVALPHLKGRALSLERAPDGVGGERFFQKDAPRYFPDWIRTVELPKRDGRVHYVTAETAATLCYLMEQACLTLHAMPCRADVPDRPDRLVVDLDPPEGGSAEESGASARYAARAVGSRLRDLGLVPYVQTSGSRGFHVVAPLDRSADFDTVRDFCMELAAGLAEAEPERLTDAQRVEDRGERVYLDVMRNAYGQTSVAPYSLRVRPGAPLATPIRWKELGSVTPRSYTIGNIFRRLGQTRDPWRGMGRHARSLPATGGRG